MNEHRLPDYLDHIQQAATDVCAFVMGLGKTISLPTNAPSRP